MSNRMEGSIASVAGLLFILNSSTTFSQPSDNNKSDVKKNLTI